MYILTDIAGLPIIESFFFFSLCTIGAIFNLSFWTAHKGLWWSHFGRTQILMELEE